MLRCFSFTAPLNVKLWKRREWAKKQKRREIKRQKGKIQRKGKESKQFSVSVITILGAKLSNYWLELLKKLITGSHRLCNRQTDRQDLISGIVHLSAGRLTTVPCITATLSFSRTRPQQLELQLSRSLGCTYCGLHTTFAVCLFSHRTTCVLALQYYPSLSLEVTGGRQ